ncbi:hypothetical protein B0T13DRAFT_32988 [Neurospora crassa]|nr:hypothetical protein B0T13DRAFT_32988 [Neurospora crassa]
MIKRTEKQNKNKHTTPGIRWSLALTGLSMGERTGSRVFQWVWSYVVILSCSWTYMRNLRLCFSLDYLTGSVSNTVGGSQLTRHIDLVDSGCTVTRIHPYVNDKPWKHLA